MPVDDLRPAWDLPVLSRADSRALGRGRRKVAPRRALAGLDVAADRDPVAHLEHQNADRVPELVPLRMQRMLANPFAFYRGTAGLMAADLAAGTSSGIPVAACGDAHISNFGFYASPERRLVFDLNDFDEAAIAPWEWDVKRLVTSVIIGGRHAGYDPADVHRTAKTAVQGYALALRSSAGKSALERYYMHLSSEFANQRMSKKGRAAAKAAIRAAQKRTGLRAIERTTERAEDGSLRFREQAPTMTRMSLADAERAGGTAHADGGIEELLEQYRASVPIDIDIVLSQYVPRDLARRVVGVGSVGTRCYLHLLVGADDDALVLQIKEAGPSVLESHGGIAQPPRLEDGVAAHGHGYRVVSMQRILQAVSDPFLGYLRGPNRDYYLRQFHDMKGSIELEGLAYEAFHDYVVGCAAVLGRSHAQSYTAGQVVGYIGDPAAASTALVTWAEAYADLSQQDYERACGRWDATTGADRDA
ncbi:DUF2252 domain-containing protein [Microbacterium sp. C7(2022)]|uniref:DUF2252 domain-containing protein n=1 Tax=Microbacterium sp. C7(2022) TaxID=2992759 RepID=UPI00237BE7D5|nr:DUF2252 domain-containing protein [Microbacterium sp. C7(2022)]MDE0545218.1 DUF2252 domain-containing protein [Microbacterium sp. C7(2022)]